MRKLDANRSVEVRYSVRKSCRVIAGGVLLAAASACASAGPAARAGDDVKLLPAGLAAVTFDSLWTMVRNTYVDTAFVASTWLSVRDSLRPRAEEITDRAQLEKLLADALKYIHDSHFYLIPAGVAPTESSSLRSDGRGTTGLAVRLADDHVVAWRVESGGAAAAHGIRPGHRIVRIAGRNADSALRRVQAMPDAARQRAYADMLHAFNGLLNTAIGDTVAVEVATTGGSPARVSLVASPGTGIISKFGNLPPIAALVTSSRVAAKSGKGCVGIIGFNIWLPALAPDLEKSVDRVRDCDGIVLDLRGNPGGVGAMVMGFGGYFMDSTRSLGVMKTRQVTLNFVINPRSTRSDGTRVPPYSGPIAIIVDPMTASTSEIFAAGMQRIGRARVFGERSAGAALPALMERLPSGDVFVHAVADFTDPSGKRIEGAGVTPDVEIPLRSEDLLAGRDAALDAAVAWITAKDS